MPANQHHAAQQQFHPTTYITGSNSYGGELWGYSSGGQRYYYYYPKCSQRYCPQLPTAMAHVPALALVAALTLAVTTAVVVAAVGSNTFRVPC